MRKERVLEIIIIGNLKTINKRLDEKIDLWYKSVIIKGIGGQLYGNNTKTCRRIKIKIRRRDKSKRIRKSSNDLRSRNNES